MVKTQLLVRRKAGAGLQHKTKDNTHFAQKPLVMGYSDKEKGNGWFTTENQR
jgi:hypothetical protein